MTWNRRGEILALLLVVLLLGSSACMDDDDEEDVGVEAEHSPVTYPGQTPPIVEATIPSEGHAEQIVDLRIVDGEFETEEEFFVPANEEVTINVNNEDDVPYRMSIGDETAARDIPGHNVTHVVIEAPESGTFEARLFPVGADEVLDTVTFRVEEDEGWLPSR